MAKHCLWTIKNFFERFDGTKFTEKVVDAKLRNIFDYYMLLV